MQTKVVRGCPKDVIEKRKARIQEALDVKFENPYKPVKFLVDTLKDGTEVYFMKPGKEYFRKEPNLNDMFPNVGDMFSKFSFKDVWVLLCILRNNITLELYKKLSVILYRIAYLLDFDYVDGKVRFVPCQEIIDEIEQIQKEVDLKGLNLNIFAFLHFVDILGWNDEMKTQANNDGINFDTRKPKKGRINTILSCIAVPILIQKFVDNVIENRDNVNKIDFSIIVNMAQTFARTRGINPLSNKELVELLSPELFL